MTAKRAVGDNSRLPLASRPVSALVLSAALAVAAAACREAPPPSRLAVVSRILEVAADPRPDDAVAYCELGGESRPSVGCVPSHPVSAGEVVVAGTELRRTIDTPAGAIGAPAIVESKLLDPAKGSPYFLPGFAVPDPIGRRTELAIPLPPGVPAGRARLELRLRPVSEPVRETASPPIDVPAGAVLDVGMALDPLAQWMGVSPVAMEVVARRAQAGAPEHAAIPATSGDAVRASADERVLLRRLLRPGTDDVGRWQDHRVDLSPVAGERVRIALRSRVVAAPGGEADFLYGFPVWGLANVLAPAADATPNVLLVSLDTLRADHLGVYGSPLATSPEIDRFAAEGTLFERAYATWPSTLHSHLSLFTGRYPSAFGEVAIDRKLSPAVPTLPELMARAGYQTAAVTEDALLRAALGFQRGVDSYRENRGSAVARAPGQADKTFADGLAWLERHRDERWFLFLHTYQVHEPYTPPPETDVFRTWSDSGVERPVGPDTPRAVRDQRLYAGEVLYTDGLFRRLLDGIAALGLARDTVVVLTSDHGEEFGEHGAMGHGKVVYRESVHVPLILRAPGIAPAGLRVPVQVSGIDVLPTLLEIAAIAPPDGIQGRSLLALLEDPQAPGWRDRIIYSELASRSYRHFGARDGSHTWIFEGGLDAPAARILVFDRRADPAEQRPLADAALAARGAAARESFAAAAAAARAALSVAAVAGDAGAPDAATAAKLRALGYAE